MDFFVSVLEARRNETDLLASNAASPQLNPSHSAHNVVSTCPTWMVVVLTFSEPGKLRQDATAVQLLWR